MSFEVPGEDVLTRRLDSVLSVIYLIFNEGYAATGRRDAAAATSCARRRSGSASSWPPLCPTEPEGLGLLALMLFHDSRRGTRTGAARRADPAVRPGPLPLGPGADRGRRPGAERALRPGRPGRYQVEAAIAALHAEAPSAAGRSTGHRSRRCTRNSSGSSLRPSSRSTGRWRSPRRADRRTDSPSSTGSRGSSATTSCTPCGGLPAPARIAVRGGGDAYRQALELARNPVEKGFLARRLDELARERRTRP